MLDELAVAVRGPSVAEIKCYENNDGTITVQYLPTAPGEYAIVYNFHGTNNKAETCKALITGLLVFLLFVLKFKLSVYSYTFMNIFLILIHKIISYHLKIWNLTVYWFPTWEIGVRTRKNLLILFQRFARKMSSLKSNRL